MGYQRRRLKADRILLNLVKHVVVLLLLLLILALLKAYMHTGLLRAEVNRIYFESCIPMLK